MWVLLLTLLLTSEFRRVESWMLKGEASPNPRPPPPFLIDSIACSGTAIVLPSVLSVVSPTNTNSVWCRVRTPSAGLAPPETSYSVTW
jgi:hypothetical protein